MSRTLTVKQYQGADVSAAASATYITEGFGTAGIAATISELALNTAQMSADVAPTVEILGISTPVENAFLKYPFHVTGTLRPPGATALVSLRGLNRTYSAVSDGVSGTFDVLVTGA